ncbi:hypothetical protein GGR53DRAFT_462584 [Hypoxylon sp. FL1150]|nr:hypothetical protein GGR53DRAFT_462584 [Hypoxylon sp. FL1150]
MLGQAITQGRTSSDWKYYGGTLATDAKPCGLSTTPLSGTQPNVGPATPAGSAATCSSAISVSEGIHFGSYISHYIDGRALGATESSTGYTTASATESAPVTSATTTDSITYATTATGTTGLSDNGIVTTSSGDFMAPWLSALCMPLRSKHLSTVMGSIMPIDGCMYDTL